MKRVIVGLSGLKGSGKDTVCQILLEELEEFFPKRIAFADALKAEVAKACGVTVEAINAYKEVYRPILQWWGTDFRRQHCCNNNYWVDKVRDKIDDLCLTGVVIITDVRFLNEVALIREYGGELWRIIRSNQYNADDHHRSETELANYQRFDRVIINADTLERLKEVVRTNLVSEIRKKL